MNSDEDIKLERAKIALAILRQKVERIFEIAPNLREIDSLKKLPKEKAGIIEEQLWSIFAYGEYYVEKVMSDISKPMLSVKSRENFNYYRKTYKPLIKKIKELVDNPWAIPARKNFEAYLVDVSYDGNTRLQDIYVDLDFYEKCATTGLIKNYIKLYIKNRVDHEQPINRQDGAIKDSEYPLGRVMYSALDFWKNTHYISDESEGEFDKWNISRCIEIINKPYFNIDDWDNNEMDLSPVVVTEEINRIPTHIQKRNYEIYHSFIFGNWMSVIALSRCLLEYALIHRKSLLEKRLNRKIEIKDHKGRTKRIGELAEIATESFPELGESMENVIAYGNYVMHPLRRTIPDKNLAKHCIDEINKIIGTLYSK